MRKEKLAELHQLIKQYKIVEEIHVKEPEKNFLTIATADYKLANGVILKNRQELIKRDGLSSASIILPITKEGEVILVVQPRPLTKSGVGVELPAGYKDLNNHKEESGKIAALRELREETGYVGKKVYELGGYYQDQGNSRAYNECYLITDCVYDGKQKLDQGEHISIFTCYYEEMLELLAMNYINDAGSIITIEKSKPLIDNYIK